MKYQHSMIIKLPREEIIAKFSDPDLFPKWQRGFVFFKPISGELGKEGSKNLLKYNMGNREIEMTETVLNNDLPDSFAATYEAKGVYNIQQNQFIDKGNETEWICDSEFKFSGMMKVIGALMPKAFKKQSYQFMTDFKAFAEDGTEVPPE